MPGTWRKTPARSASRSSRLRSRKSTPPSRSGPGAIFRCSRRWAIPGAALLLAGCSVGPDYHRPEVVVPAAYGWKIAEPRDAEIKGEWWKAFHDPVLDGLETQAQAANQNLSGAFARFEQARSIARLTSADFLPRVTAAPSVMRFRTPPTTVPPEFTATVITTPLDLSYEIDLWGRVRRSFEAAQAEAQAGASEYANVLLGLTGDVAGDYFLLRQLDAATDILNRTIALREKAVNITRQRFHAGLSPELDFNRAQTELAQTHIDLADTVRRRADLQDALALLCGQISTQFKIAPAPPPAAIPPVPLGLPSDLLERRPDVAEAERRMAAANARIGVAYAAFFPAISLTGSAGYSSFTAGTLLNWESRLFEIGPSISLPLLNGGRTEAGVQEARAGYNAACADYRQEVLTAFRDVSDAVNDLDGYAREADAEKEALAAANESFTLAQRSYNNGLSNYLEVVDAERTALQIQLEAAQILAQRQVATVHLIKALGGGFDTPKTGYLGPAGPL
jgi:multidrug efflux system outer membrane protein